MKVIKDIVRKTLWTVHKCIPIPVQLFRYVLSFVHDKDLYRLKSETEPFAKIYDSGFWESAESKSGTGSTMQATEAIREALPRLFTEYSIQTMIDTPCGDFNWMKSVDKSQLKSYTGGDIVAQAVACNNERYAGGNVSFRVIDITTDELPSVDLIFCRDCLQHLSHRQAIKALNNFKRSGSRLLLTTNYPATWRNYDILDGDYRALNLEKPPFSYPPPIKIIVETKRVGNEVDKIMSLYCLDNVPYIS